MWLEKLFCYPYFSSEALQFDSEHSYADAETVLTNKTEYNWNHSLSDIFHALLSEGLSIDFFHEFPFCGWQYFSDMETGEDGWSRLKDEQMRQRVPLMFSLKATKK